MSAVKHLTCLVCLFVIGLASHAQVSGQIDKLQDLTIEYGDLRELHGARVFVHSENLASRPRILREVAKYPRLKVVGRREDADFILLFGPSLLERGAFGGSDYFSSSNGINNDSIDMVALIMINAPSPRIRVCWVSTKHRASLSTPSLLDVLPLDVSPKSQLIRLLLTGFLYSHAKLKSVPLNRPPEVKAAREFIKALRNTQGEVR
jgi:hypothetical protein